MSLFDDAQNISFDIINKVFGEEALWTPVSTGITLVAQVFFNAPSSPDKVSGTRYFPFDYEMEYRVGFFDGLLELIREGVVQTVTIKSVIYFVTEVKAKFDGKTISVCLKEA